MKTLIVVRHGQKEKLNTFNDLIGKKAQLTQLGRQQAVLTGKYILAHYGKDFDSFVASPFLRTIQTAKCIQGSLKLPFWLDARIGERIFITEDVDSITSKQYFEKAAENHEWAPPGGESLNSINKRFNTAIEHLLHKNNKILLVSHGRILQTWLSKKVADPQFQKSELVIENCSISELILDSQLNLIDTKLNSISHLSELVQTTDKDVI